MAKYVQSIVSDSLPMSFGEGVHGGRDGVEPGENATTHSDGAKKLCKSWGINDLQYQLVNAGFLNHQQEETGEGWLFFVW